MTHVRNPNETDCRGQETLRAPRRHGVALAVATITLSCLFGCDDSGQGDPLDDAVDALGGQEILQRLRTLTVEAAGVRSVLDEGLLPGDAPLGWGRFVTKSNIDIAGARLAIDYTRDIEAPILGGDVTLQAREVTDGDLGAISGQSSIFSLEPGDSAMLSDRLRALQVHTRLLHPYWLMHDVLANRSAVRRGDDVSRDGTSYSTLIIDAEPAPITLFVAPGTGRIDGAETTVNDFLRRDSALEVEYDDWQPSGELAFPKTVTMTMAGHVIFQTTRSSLAVNEVLSDGLFAFPDGVEPEFDAQLAQRGNSSHQYYHTFAGIGAPRDGIQTQFTAVPLAEGVHHLRSSHHSLAIEQSEGIVIVEAPLDEIYAQALIDWASETFPDKPITHVISSHHHVDHSAGLRAFVAAGAAVVLHEAGRDFFAGVFEAPSTLLPDQLQDSPTQARIVTAGANDRLVLDDSLRPIHVYPMPTAHAGDMVIVHVPGPDILFVSDIYNPGLPLSPSDTTEALYQSIVARQIPVSLIAGGHGSTATLDELAEMVGAK